METEKTEKTQTKHFLPNRQVMIWGGVFVLIVLVTTGLWGRKKFFPEKSSLIPDQRLGLFRKDLPENLRATSNLSLKPEVATIELEKEFAVEITVETQNSQVAAAEIILSFDPDFLEVVDRDEEKEGIQLEESGIFDEYLINLADNQKGEIILSGFNWEKEFSQGTLATIIFKPRRQGVALVNFISAPGEKRKSDVVTGSGQSTLTKTVNGEFTIE